MGTRIEILKDGLWQIMTLQSKRALRYNAVINKIGKVDTREISHSNTFSIPKIDNNIRILGLEVGNQARLAKALNTKYPAKYYIEDKLLRVGFVVINNTLDDVININFIDESLSIVDFWGSMSFKDLLLFESVQKPADYQAAIDEMRNYDASFNSPLQPLSEVGTRGYKLAEFPNTLNTVGDDFQINANEQRVDDTFNPYQSRPIFNAKAILDLAVESFGYTPIYDDTVNLEKIEKTYIVGSDLAGDDLEDGGFLTFQNQYWCYIGQRGNEVNWQETNPVWAEGAEHEQIYDYLQDDRITPYSNASRPADIPGWFTPAKFHDGPYINKYCIIRPTILDSTVGQIVYTDTFQDKNGSPTSSVGRTNFFAAYAIWMNSAGTAPIFVELDAPDDPDSNATEWFIDKSDLQNTPPGAGDFVGIIAGYNANERPRNARDSNGNLITLQISNGVVVSDYWVYGTPFYTYTESVLPTDIITFDDHNQYIADQLDLTFGAPTNKIKALVSGIAQKESILIDINTQDKEVKFFSYELYAVKRVLGDFVDWSDYLLKGNRMSYNTNYGNNYGKVNEISLNTPYKGNIYRYNLNNAFDDVKYKDVAKNQVQLFKDVSKAIKVNYTNSPYVEFSTSGLSMVEVEGEITNFTQTRFDASTQGTIPSVAQVVNVNYSTISRSIQEWYNLINTSIKVDAQFLLPVQEVSNFRLDTPVYVEELGGYYIVEEISEYTDSYTPVTCKLIKINLSDETILDLRTIILNSTLTDSTDVTTAQIDSAYTVTGVLPNTLDIYYQFTDSVGTDIGSPTIVSLPVTASGNAPTFNITKSTTDIQYIKVYILDDTGLQSNVETFEISRYINPGFTIDLDITQTFENVNENDFDLTYQANGFTPTELRLGMLLSTISPQDGTTFSLQPTEEGNYTGNYGPNTDNPNGNVQADPDGTLLASPSGVYSTEANKDSTRDKWRIYYVHDPIQLVFSEAIAVYIESGQDALYRITNGASGSAPDFTFTLDQAPSPVNGYEIKATPSRDYSLGIRAETEPEEASNWIFTIIDESRGFPESKSFRISHTVGSGLGLEQIQYTFDASNSIIAKPGTYRAKFTYDTFHSGWVNFTIV